MSTAQREALDTKYPATAAHLRNVAGVVCSARVSALMNDLQLLEVLAARHGETTSQMPAKLAILLEYLDTHGDVYAPRLPRFSAALGAPPRHSAGAPPRAGVSGAFGARV